MDDTVRAQLLRLAGDARLGLRFEGSTWTWAEVVQAAVVHSSVLRELLPPDRPPHVGVLLDNTPPFAFLLGAAALGGQVLVGLDPHRSRTELAHDVARTDVSLVLTDGGYEGSGLLADVDVPALRVDSPEWLRLVEGHGGARVPEVEVTPDTLMMLIFTSGTSGDPKAVRVTQQKVARPGRMLADRCRLGAEDVAYVCMPLFHSNAVMAGFGPAVAAGATLALTRRFSPRTFVADVRRHRATYSTYVGGALARVLATPERPDDADNPLRVMLGNEGREKPILEFARRFDCQVIDGFVSTEHGGLVERLPDQPPGSLGRLVDGVGVLDRATGRPTADAEFGAGGELLNPVEATGELVDLLGAGDFAGYYRDDRAERERLRDGRYWSGDLAYRDADGWVYFAGRASDVLSLDGEEVFSAPVERVLLRHPAVSQAAVYAVQDGSSGGAVLMAALAVLERPDPEELATFLAGQDALPARHRPCYLRLIPAGRGLPVTVTFKVNKRDLAALGTWPSEDEIWRQSPDGSTYTALA